VNIQWYPGHMTKTRRMIEENLKYVDIIAEIIDARIPVSSRNPDIDALVGAKPRLIILNRADQSDPSMNRVWGDWFRARGYAVMECDAKSGKGVNQFSNAVKSVLKEKIDAWRKKGMVGRPVKAMVVGGPNVGKSTFINKVAGRKSAKAQDKPGVTRGKQWVAVDSGLDLLDTPGILWPKFEDERTGMHLAFTGAVRDEIMDTESLASELIFLLSVRYPESIRVRYKIDLPEGATGWTLLEKAARKRGFLVSGGEPDLERMANVLLDEYRGGKLGTFTLEVPEDLIKENAETVDAT